MPVAGKPKPQSVEAEIAHLRGLDLTGLRARWRSVFRRKAPEHMPRHLLFRCLAYHLQAERFGDLDYATRSFLDRAGAGSAAEGKAHSRSRTAHAGPPAARHDPGP
jgi:DUF2924 family protein